MVEARPSWCWVPRRLQKVYIYICEVRRAWSGGRKTLRPSGEDV